MDFSHYGGASEEFLEVQKKFNAPFDPTIPIDEQKKTVNRFREDVSAKAMETLGKNVTTADHSIPTRDGSSIEARTYRPVSKSATEKLPVYMHLHGGGFVFGTLSSDDALCALLADKAGVIVFNVNYRHTPEHTFPVAWDDSQDAFAWLHANVSTINADPEKVIVGGISAGGQLTGSLVLEKHIGKALTGLPKIVGQILMIPCLSSMESFKQSQAKQLKSPEVSSYVQNKDAPVLSEKTIKWFTSLLKTPDPVPLDDTRINIGNATSEQVKGMAPTVFGICGLDPLRDEALLYAKHLAENGVPTDTSLFWGVPHGFTRYGAALKQTENWNRVMAEGITWCLNGPKAGAFDVKILK